MVCYRTDDQVRSYNKICDCSKRVQMQNRNRIKHVKIWLLRKSYILLKVQEWNRSFFLSTLWVYRGFKILQKLVQRSQS